MGYFLAYANRSYGQCKQQFLPPLNRIPDFLRWKASFAPAVFLRLSAQLWISIDIFIIYIPSIQIRHCISIKKTKKMPVLKLNAYFTKFFPSSMVRSKELVRRRYSMKVAQVRRSYNIKFNEDPEFECDATVTNMPQSLKTMIKRKLLSKRVIGSFRLRFHSNSFKKRLEITATITNPTVPSDTDLAPEDEQLYELYICSSQGQLLGKIPFLESDYRRAAREAIDFLAF